MNILCITHADFETPGVIETWAKNKNHRFEIKKPYQGQALPKYNSFDFLVVMGGPQSPIHVEETPYLKDEILLIRKTLAGQKPILGFCLGAQLIGEALGAKTLRSPEKEVGVYPITLTETGRHDPLLRCLPKDFSVIHWHNDMPGLLKDSEILAFSKGCPRQIVRYRRNVYGFQCHLEITLEGIRTMIKAVPDDLKPSKFTQNERELLSQDYSVINQKMIMLLDQFTQLRA